MFVLDLEKAKKAAEERLGIEIDDDVAGKVLSYAARKVFVNGKGIDYLPILYENELVDFYIRAAINLVGGRAYVM